MDNNKLNELLVSETAQMRYEISSMLNYHVGRMGFGDGLLLAVNGWDTLDYLNTLKTNGGNILFAFDTFTMITNDYTVDKNKEIVKNLEKKTKKAFTSANYLKNTSSIPIFVGFSFLGFLSEYDYEQKNGCWDNGVYDAFLRTNTQVLLNPNQSVDINKHKQQAFNLIKDKFDFLTAGQPQQVLDYFEGTEFNYISIDELYISCKGFKDWHKASTMPVSIDRDYILRPDKGAALDNFMIGFELWT